MGGWSLVYQRRGLRRTTYSLSCIYQLTDKQRAIIHRCVCIRAPISEKLLFGAHFSNVDFESYVKLVMLTLEPHQHTVFFEKIRCH